MHVNHYINAVEYNKYCIIFTSSSSKKKNKYVEILISVF